MRRVIKQAATTSYLCKDTKINWYSRSVGLFFSHVGHFAGEEAFEFLCRKAESELSFDGHADVARLLRHDDGDGIALLRDAHSGTVAKAEFLGDAVVVGNGEHATGCLDAVLTDDHGTVVEWGVLEEDVLDEAIADDAVDDLSGAARVDHFVEWCAALNDDERAHTSSGHVHAGIGDGEDLLVVGLDILAPRAVEKLYDAAQPLMGPKGIEKLAYLLLKQYDEADDTHRHQFVHDGSKQPHLQHLADKEPHDDEHHDADEDIERAALLHQAVDIIEEQGDEDDVDDILDSKFEGHRLFFVGVGGGVHLGIDPAGFHGRSHVVYAQYVGTLDECQRVDHSGAVERFFCSDVEQLADHALAAHTDQQGETEDLKAVEVVEHGVVLVDVLAESEARVEDDVVLSQVVESFHGIGHALHDAFHGGLYRLVDIGTVESGYGREHFCIGPLADVVDDVGVKLLNGHAGYGGSEGVDRYNGIGHHASDNPQCLSYTLHFGRLVAGLAAGAGAATAHVDDLSALVKDLASTAGNGVFALNTAFGIERIGRTVQYAHHDGLGKRQELATCVDG